MSGEYYTLLVFYSSNQPQTSPENTQQTTNFLFPFSLQTNEVPTLSRQIRNKNGLLLIGESVIPVSRMKDDKVFYLKILAHFKLGKW